jgi:hypothetical protein
MEAHVRSSKEFDALAKKVLASVEDTSEGVVLKARRALEQVEEESRVRIREMVTNSAIKHEIKSAVQNELRAEIEQLRVEAASAAVWRTLALATATIGAVCVYLK